MNKVALITYHAAYNFGSALQALATQNVIRDISGDCTIINYRMLSQKKFYSNIRTGLGFKTFLKDFLRLPAWKQLNIRATRFENFQENYFNLSSCFTTPEEIYRYWNEFDTIVSGSDQIWNKHSCELENVSFNYMFPYLLKDYCGKKISYASSIGNMTDADLETIHLYIDEFSSISMRESSSAARLSKLLNREIPTVLDPTLLLSGNEWKETLKINDYSNEPYILYYSLSYYKEINKWIPALERLAKNHNMKVKIITPFVYLKLNKDIFERHYDYGPVEFVDALNNAAFVLTDSYHGTLFSLNLHKKFGSICLQGGSEFRKTDILKRLEMNNNIIDNPKTLDDYYNLNINYSKVEDKLSDLREKSKQYLLKSINA